MKDKAVGKKASSKNFIAISVCLVILAVSIGLLVDRLLTTAEGPSSFVPVKAVAGSGNYCLAIDAEGHIWAWGRNAYGKLGDGTSTNRLEPTRHNNIHHDRKYVEISAGDVHSLAIDTDGYLWAWGRNHVGQLGDGTTSTSYAPVRQNGTHFNRKYTAIAAGDSYSLALDTDGYLWAWGGNNAGQLGDGTTTGSLEPKRQNGVHANRKYTAIITGNYGSCYAIDTDGYLWVWGYNNVGQLGDGTQTNSLEPIRQNGAHGMRKYTAISSYAHALALDTDGHIWVWGDSFNGRLGIGATGGAPVLEPVRHNGAHADRKYVTVAAGDHVSFAIDEDGYMWAWGTNYMGAIGFGTAGQPIEPARYPDPLSEHYSRKYASVSAGYYCGIALDIEGYLWAWGANGNGNIGDGTTTSSSNPVQISFIKPTFDPGGDPITPDPYDPEPTKPAPVKKDREPISIDEAFLLYALFGAGILVLIALLIVSYTQRDRKPKKKVTIFQSYETYD